MPAALAVDWEAIKQAAIAGVPIPDLARQWGMIDEETGKPDTTAIRKRSSREEWPIPRAVIERAHKKLAEAKAAVANLVTDVSQDGVTLSQRPAKPVDLAADSLVDGGNEASAIAQGIALRSLRSAPKKLTVTDFGDVKTAMQIARTAAGMDRAQVQVAVALAPKWGSVVQSEAADWSEHEDEP